MVSIKKDLVPAGLASQVTYKDGYNPCKYIVVHETANTKAGADAQAHANLQKNGNSREASWHYQVDDKGVIQSFDDRKQCWHAGSRVYNQNAIGIELCVNSGGDFKKTVDNAAELIKMLMNKYGIPVKNVLTHKETSGGKDCPHFLRSGSKGVTWAQLISKISSTSSSSGKTPSKPAKTPSKPAKSPSGSGSINFNTNSIVDFLSSAKLDSSFANRKKLAGKYGISNYSGTAAQNESLLAKLKSDFKSTSKPAPKPASKGDQKTNSIVDYLVSIKADSSFANRKKLADKYGISNYRGTAAQNSTLLKKIRGK
ncbi:putative N-acetylmuramoyl-L-alanine amidase [Bacillus phage phiAGATE]|uniref:N-acetylmuramoyl-L-alanine amidase n=1 Tax=Bacillus phage phiAGATE TaxID=1204533 RepID=L0LC28_9CAUD|nr:endolysin [Bacillus phage phiAGATE]AGB62631.1 putative N-acetylmuramoyl-L-alanine amidase [Bacillus phage phiAGATE]